jgi:hypothetical protein
VAAHCEGAAAGDAGDRIPQQLGVACRSLPSEHARKKARPAHLAAHRIGPSAPTHTSRHSAWQRDARVFGPRREGTGEPSNGRLWCGGALVRVDWSSSSDADPRPSRAGVVSPLIRASPPPSDLLGAGCFCLSWAVGALRHFNAGSAAATVLNHKLMRMGKYGQQRSVPL